MTPRRDRKPGNLAGPMVLLAAVWLVLAVAYGTFFSFSIFLVPLLEEFGWSRAATAGALSVSTGVQGMLAPVVGAVVDRLGPRRVVLLGVALVGAGAAMTATVRSLAELYLWTGVVTAAGLVGVGWVPMGVLIARNFASRRASVTGVAFSGMGVGVLVFGPLAQVLIDAAGWRAATLVLGAGALVILLPVAWIALREPDLVRGAPVGAPGVSDRKLGDLAGPSGPTVADALRTRAFWALFVAYCATPLAVFPVFTHQVAFAVDLGFPRMLVASVFGVMGLMSTLGRAGFGLAADRIGGPLAATLSFGCSAGGALALVALERWPLAPWLWAYAMAFGLGFGARGPIVTAMATERFGGRRFGAIFGVLNLGNGLGAAIGPWLGGFVHDVTGSYRAVFLGAVGFAAIGSAGFWLARGPVPAARLSRGARLA